MRLTWLLLIVAFGVLSTIGLITTIPVGVNAEEVREEVESLRMSDEAMSHDDAIAAATEYLRGEQRRRVRFLFAAYMAIWTLLGGYTVTLARRQARLRKALDRVDAGQWGSIRPRGSRALAPGVTDRHTKRA